jgi:predicted RNA-binding protein YlqC (UPF0109 family)
MPQTQSEKFQEIVDLVEHMAEELVDDPEDIEISATCPPNGNTGAIEVCGSSREIAKIMGSKKNTLRSIQTIVYAVASKYGFRVMLNVINREQRDRFRSPADRAPTAVTG